MKPIILAVAILALAGCVGPHSGEVRTLITPPNQLGPLSETGRHPFYEACQGPAINVERVSATEWRFQCR
jgi:hypothetical protein